MAAIQLRGESYRVLFRYQGQQHAVTIGEVSKTEANQWAAKIDHILMRLKQNMLELPAGVPITSFVMNDGKRPANPLNHATFGQLRDKYLATREASLEAGTVNTLRLQLAHIEPLIDFKPGSESPYLLTWRRISSPRTARLQPEERMAESLTNKLEREVARAVGAIGGAFAAANDHL
jgi:hypothetical protein